MNSFKKNWDEMARAYEEFTEGKNSYSFVIEWPCFMKMLPVLNNKDILELGCGSGRFTFLLEEKEPRSIKGIDISKEMLKMAKEKGKKKNSNACFIEGDISDLDKYNVKVDFIFSSTTFHYISDLKKLFQDMYNSLNDNGECIISLMHPIYSAQYPLDKNGEFPEDDEWQVRYLDKSLRSYIQPWIEYNDKIEIYLSTSYHYTFSDYINAAISAGFTLEEVQEPEPPKEWKERYPEMYEGFMETPSFMIIKIRK